jgi:hypothetical protein
VIEGKPADVASGMDDVQDDRSAFGDPGDELENLIEIGVGRSGDDQLLRRNRASPREMMSAFIASAPGDFRNSPCR